ncbi:Mut7-C RNAse domain-containing protein [Desulfocurvus sp. DL9XJH121]
MSRTPEAIFTFHDDVRQFLEPGNRGRGKLPREAVRQARQSGVVRYPVDRAASLKDVIEALGVPHTEVGRILADGLEAGFGQPLEPGLEVHVFAVAAPVDVTRPCLLRPAPLPRAAFVVDANVAKLGALLRMLGLDAAGNPAWDDEDIARVAAREGRIVLSRDRALLKRSAVTHGRLLRAERPREQLLEILAQFGLRGPFSPLGRCLRCNEPLLPVPKAEILHRLLPLTRKHYHDFHRCPACGRVYWAGSHHGAMLAWLREAGVQGVSQAGE